MKCIYCSNKKTEVVNSRKIKKGFMTWRRRYCPSCKKIFTTKESTIADNLFVLKRNGSRQRFIYEKLFVSIFNAINARKNRDSGDDAKLAKRISGKIIEKIFPLAPDKIIPSKTIIEQTYRELKKISSYWADRYISYSDYRLKAILPGPVFGEKASRWF